MRTTVNLPDPLLIEAKKLAAEQSISFTRILEESLRLYLAEERTRQRLARKSLSLPLFRDPRPVPGIDLDDTSELLEIE